VTDTPARRLQPLGQAERRVTDMVERETARQATREAAHANGHKLISIITPAFDEEDCIEELCRRLQQVFAENPTYEFEVVIVENGSTDGTFAKLKELRAADARFKILQLARNFRMDGGITAGLDYVSGDACVIMTADLQDPPELIGEFIRKWEEGFDNVYMKVTKRVGTGPIRRMNAQIFYWLLARMTGGVFPRNVSDFRLVDRKVYETVKGMHERNRFLRGMFYWAGFSSYGVEHERPPRFAGETKAYTLQVIELALKGILSFSYVPLRLITWMGLAMSGFAFAFLIYIVVRAFVWGVPFAGFGTIMGVMLLLFGFLFTMLGVVAEYVGLIYDEVKQRPNYIVRDTFGL
jgi:glycosyltransferase involved in cell wall biosynthesis